MDQILQNNNLQTPADFRSLAANAGTGVLEDPFIVFENQPQQWSRRGTRGTASQGMFQKYEEAHVVEHPVRK